MTNTELSQGQNRDISGSAIDVLLLWPESLGVLDATAFILGADGKTKVDNDMVFFNQPYGAGGAVELKNSRTGSTTFTVLADRLPPSVQRIVFCLTVDEKTPSGTTIKNFDGLSIVAKTSDSASFRPDLSKATEMAMMVAEIYRRGDGFKIRAIGQGFNGGLGPLARSFGVSLEDEAPVPAPPAVPPPASVPSSISLKKVTLEKLGKVSLDKRSGAIKAVLSWEGRGGGGDGDLEFYCYYVDKSGKCGTIYWNNLGSPSQHPFIAHSGDSQVAGSETIVIHEPEELKFALFAAYSALGNGAGSFLSFRPVVTLTDAAGNEVRIPLLNPNEASYWVAISHLAFGQTTEISHVETYNTTIMNCERAPRLHADGKWDVAKGVIEFK